MHSIFGNYSPIPFNGHWCANPFLIDISLITINPYWYSLFINLNAISLKLCFYEDILNPPHKDMFVILSFVHCMHGIGICIVIMSMCVYIYVYTPREHVCSLGSIVTMSINVTSFVLVGVAVCNYFNVKHEILSIFM